MPGVRGLVTGATSGLGLAVRTNLLFPGGATATGMIPDGAPRDLLDPGVMGPPIVWVASPEAADVHDERIVASRFEDWLAAPG